MISIKDNRIRWAISAVLALLILFGTYRNVFSLAAFLIMGLILVFCDVESNILQIFFVMPMANIFKFTPGVQSFFTVIILVYVILHLVLPRRATFVVALFAVYVIIGQLFMGQFDFFRTVKLVCNLLFLSSVLNKDVEISGKEIFLSYSIGNLIASVFGTMNSAYFKIESYTGVKELSGSMYESETARFMGLHSDPNYYAVSIIVSLCLIIVLYHRREINTLFALSIAVPMVYFLIITYSKSAILMTFVCLVFLVYSLILNRKYFSLILIIIALVIVLVLVLSGQIPLFETMITRFTAAEESEEVDINALTTGRVDIWMMYIKYIITNIKTAVFGDGISATYYNGIAAHNTYIDIFRHLGVVGGVLLVISLRMILMQSVSAPKKKYNMLNYSVIFCMLIMYFFLSELFSLDAPFHIFLAFTVMNMSVDAKETLKSPKHSSLA